MGKMLLRVSTITGILFIALTGLFLAVVPWIVDFLYKPVYGGAVQLVWILATSHLVMGFGVIVEPFYIYSNRMKTCIAINLFMTFFLIPTGYFFNEYAGVTGVAWYLALIRCTVVVHFAYIFYYYWKARREGSGTVGAGAESA
jgi:O-antigen/teichoic acid export membrane protein